MYKIISVILLGAVTAVFAAVQTPEVNKHSGMDCAVCHTAGVENPAPAEACEDCHGGFADVAELTDMHEFNPHAPHEPYNEISCTNCHANHKESVNYCDTCHDTGLKVP